MMKFATTVLAVFTLAPPAFSVAGEPLTNSHPKPSSFVAHPHTSHHVYGAPIAPAIVGHAKTSHHKRAPRKRA
jgi:hypothetical protein